VVSDQSEIRNERSPKSEIGHKPIIGLAGGIGSGKSTVAAQFAKLGCLVLDSDRQSHEVLGQPDVVAELVNWLGSDVLDAAGMPVRKKIADRVFGKPDQVDRLTGLIHPRVARLRDEAILRAQDDPAVAAVVIDSPLLFEAGVDRQCDGVVFVDAPLDQRIARVAADRGWSADQVEARQKHQMDLEQKRARCRWTIRNDGRADELVEQVRRVLAEVLGERHR
jgi:dephospho-CoA kinase